MSYRRAFGQSDGGCLPDEAAVAYARLQCEDGYGGGAPECSHFTVCPPVQVVPAIVPTIVPEPELEVQTAPSETEDKTWGLEGVVVLLVVGGIGYGLFRAKKGRR